jgi:hypothetical protein
MNQRGSQLQQQPSMLHAETMRFTFSTRLLPAPWIRPSGLVAIDAGIFLRNIIVDPHLREVRYTGWRLLWSTILQRSAWPIHRVGLPTRVTPWQSLTKDTLYG